MSWWNQKLLKTTLTNLHLKAYAKINLGLKVLDKRPDGYHNIESIIQSIDFFDELEISPLKLGIEFISNIPPYGEENICFKAAELFLNSINFKTGVSIKLKKQIWQGAGLGGGSSCAAQTLIGMNKILDSPLKVDKLLELALKLGSDVPFFIENSPAVIRGRGEIIERLPYLTKPLYLVLVYPGFSISTKWAYEKIHNLKKLTNKQLNINMAKVNFLNGNIEKLAKEVHNDFETVVFESHPELKSIKEKLIQAGSLGASLSGTGSCIYGIIKEMDKKFTELFPKFSVRLAKAI